MLNKFLKFTERNFGLLLVICSIVTFFVPEYFTWGENSTDILLILGLFLGFLKIDFSEIFHLKNNFDKLIIYSLISLIALPLIFYVVSPGLDPDLRIGIFLLLGISGAVMTPFLASLLKLNILWVVAFVVLTSLLMPFTLPFLIKFLFSISLKIDIFNMMIFLGKLIFVPSLLSMFFKKFLPTITAKSLKYSGFLGVIIMVLFIAFLVAKNHQFIAQNAFEIETIWSLVILFLVFFLRFLIGYFLPHENTRAQWTNSLMFGNMNNGLVILLAAEFFSEKVLFIALLSEIPWILSQPVFQKVKQIYYKHI